ncbi:MAG: M48 family metallopeptidase [Xanthomonadales bacterium]|nr:M48 family metallopeptidase [Xanthomonadales bacterium]
MIRSRDSTAIRKPRRPVRMAAAVALALASTGVVATGDGEYGLPDIGSSAAAALSPSEQAEYGAETLRELRHYGLVLEDPLLEDWISGLGYRVVAAGERPEQPFTFFLLNFREVNAWATLGGYIAMNAGLVLEADSEDEVAAVLSHEVAHVTQQHILRSVEKAKQEALPIALGMLGAVLAAQSGGGHGDATQAALVSGLALIQQRRINYTRTSEQEADRVGIRTLARAGFDPMAMADFFQAMQRLTRGEGANVPEYLRTHPLTTSRISEAKDRARSIRAEGVAGNARIVPDGLENPLLPQRWKVPVDAAPAAGADRDRRLPFLMARERLRVLSAGSPALALGFYPEVNSRDPVLAVAQSYGRALAQTRAGKAAAAIAVLTRLAESLPDDDWIQLALADAEHRDGKVALAEARYERLLRNRPQNRAVILAYAQALNERGGREAGERAVAALRPLLDRGGDDLTLQRSFARASELAGDSIRAGEAHAEAAYLSGRPQDALNQLERIKEQPLDYYQRARIDARIAAMTPTVLERERRGLKPGQEDRPRVSFGIGAQ